MNAFDGINGLQFEYQLIFNDNIHSVSDVELHSLINNGQLSLPLMCETRVGQLHAQALLVGRLEEAWPKMSMHFDGCADDLVCQRILFHPNNPSVPRWLCG